MAYLFVDDETSRAQIIASDSKEYIEFLIGVDPETQDIFRAYIALGESVSLRGAELTFGILVTQRNGTEYVIFDGAETAFIPASDRVRILTSLELRENWRPRHASRVS